MGAKVASIITRYNMYFFGCLPFMEYKDDFCYLWSERQWDIYVELYETYHFDELVSQALEFIEENGYLIDEYGEDSLELILNEY